MLGKYYLYRHIRTDKGEPFYIGIGTKNEDKIYNSFVSEYSRAFSKHSRRYMWNRIVEKTPYEVEILLESNDYEFIKQKEIEFIALYGRRDIKTGILCNLTDGGEGSNGYKHSEDAKEKIKGDKNHMTFRIGGLNHSAKKVINTLTGEVFNSAVEVANILNVKSDNLTRWMRKERKNPTYFVYLKDYNGEVHHPESFNKIPPRMIKNECTGEIYQNQKDCAINLKVWRGKVKSMIEKGDCLKYI